MIGLLGVLGFAMTAPGGAVALAAASPPPRTFSVYAYDLDLRVERTQKVVTGRERLSIRAETDRLATLAFPRNGLDIFGVTSAGGAPLPHVESDGRIEITLPHPLARGRQTEVVVTYEARAPRGLVFQADGVYSAFDTCHWMVCRERPDDKATLTLALAVPKGLRSVASGAPAKSRRGPDGHPREVWREAVPSSPYLFGFALGDFARVTRVQAGTTFEYYGVGLDEVRVQRLFADDARMLAFFVEKAGRPLPRPFYRQVVVDGGVAQEVSSFSLLGRDVLEPRLADPTEDWAVAHEMAHQLWGNLVTCADWSHFWLNEGLTTFMVAAYKEQRWGRAAYDRELDLARKRRQAAIDAHLDVPLTFAGAYPSLRLKRAVTYSKAFLFLDELRQTMGDPAFWSALATYTRRFAGRAVTSRDFQAVFAAATPKDVTPLFNAWVYARAASLSP